MKCSTARWLLFCRVSAITSGCIDRVIHFIFLHWLHRCLAGWTAQSTALDRRTACAVSWLTGAVTSLQRKDDRLVWQPRSIVECLHFPTLTFESLLPVICFSQLRLPSSSFPSLCQPWWSVSDVTFGPCKRSAIGILRSCSYLLELFPIFLTTYFT